VRCGSASLVLVLLLAGCGASVPDPETPPSRPAAAPPPSSATAAASAHLSDYELPVERRTTVVLQGGAGVVVGPNRHDDTPSKGPPASTFFPKKYDSRMFGGCGATDFSGGRCPEEMGR
jgi:hypothetical protein